MKAWQYSVRGQSYNISCVEYTPNDNSAHFAIVCMHGFGGDKNSSAIKMLAECITHKDGAVVAFDFASHGKSEVNEDMLTMENCISDAKTIYAFAENRYGKADFFATSFGAYVLINLLKNADFKGVKAVFRAPAVKMADTFLKPICNLAIDELEKNKYVECGFERKMKLGYSFWQDLKNYSVDDAIFGNETLMIYGDCDDVVSPAHMAEFAENRSNIKVRIISGADHRFKGKGQLKEAICSAVDFLTSN